MLMYADTNAQAMPKFVSDRKREAATRLLAKLQGLDDHAASRLLDRSALRITVLAHWYQSTCLLVSKYLIGVLFVSQYVSKYFDTSEQVLARVSKYLLTGTNVLAY